MESIEINCVGATPPADFVAAAGGGDRVNGEENNSNPAAKAAGGDARQGKVKRDKENNEGPDQGFYFKIGSHPEQVPFDNFYFPSTWAHCLSELKKAAKVENCVQHSKE